MCPPPPLWKGPWLMSFNNGESGSQSGPFVRRSAVNFRQIHQSIGAATAANFKPSQLWVIDFVWTSYIVSYVGQQCNCVHVTGEQVYPALFCLFMAETEIHQRKENCKIKRLKNLDHHGPVSLPNIRNLFHPPRFFLQTTL
jgi:hypothetical protein